MNIPEAETLWLVGGVLAVLAIATGIAQLLKRRLDTGLNPALVGQFHLRLRAWWLMCTVLAIAFFFGRIPTVVLFGLISFWALREYITLTPTRRGDHRALFWVFFVFTPIQFVLVAWLDPPEWLGKEWAESLFYVTLPVFAFLFITSRVAWAGDAKRFLERIAKIQAGLMITVYCLSHAPALLMRDLPVEAGHGVKARILFFFVLIVQVSDAAQYLWGQLLGKHEIAADITSARSWEGFTGGVLTASIVGAALWWATPFDPWESALLAAVSAVIGFAGGLTMSAIKRDRDVRDYGTLVVGHAGVLDRIDSICFAAPVFYHMSRLFLQ